MHRTQSALGTVSTFLLISSLTHFPFISPHAPHLHNLMIHQDKGGTKSKQTQSLPIKMILCILIPLKKPLSKQLINTELASILTQKPPHILSFSLLFYLAKNLKQSLSSSFIKLLLNNFVLSNQTGYFQLTAFI